LRTIFGWQTAAGFKTWSSIADLTPERKSLYDAMRRGLANNFNAFKVLREDGALEPVAVRAGNRQGDLKLYDGDDRNATLPDNVRQIVILVVGARYGAAYEIYAHIAVAERAGMRPERLAALVADLKPADLTPEENVAFDLAYVRGDVLPEPLCRLAIETFGQHGTNEMIYLPPRAGVDHAQWVQRAGSGTGVGPPGGRGRAQQPLLAGVCAMAQIGCSTGSPLRIKHDCRPKREFA